MVKNTTEDSGSPRKGTQTPPKKTLSPKQERALARRKTEASLREANRVLTRWHSVIEHSVYEALNKDSPIGAPCSQVCLSEAVEQFIEEEGYDEYSLAYLGNHDRTGRLCYVCFYDKLGVKKAFMFEFDAAALPTSTPMYLVNKCNILDVHLVDFPKSDTNHDVEIYRDRIFRAKNQIDFVNSNNLAYEYIPSEIIFCEEEKRVRVRRLMMSQGFCMVCKTDTEARGFHMTRNNVAHAYKNLDTLERCAEAFGQGDIFRDVMKEFKHSQGSPKMERLRAPLCQPPVRTHEEIARDLVKLLKEAVNPVILHHAPPTMKSQVGIKNIANYFRGVTEELKNKPREFVKATMENFSKTLTEEFKDYISHVGHDWWHWIKSCLINYAVVAVPSFLMFTGYIRLLVAVFFLSRRVQKGYEPKIDATYTKLLSDIAIGIVLMKLGSDLLKFTTSFANAYSASDSISKAFYAAIASEYNDKSNFVTMMVTVVDQCVAWSKRLCAENNIDEQAFLNRVQIEEVPEDMKSQSGLPEGFRLPELDMDTMKNAVGSLFGLFSLTTLGQQPDAKGYKDFLQSMGALPRAVEGTMKLYEYLESMIQKVISFVRRKALGDERLHYANLGMPALDEWCEQVVAMHHSALMSELEINTDNFVRIYQLHITGLQFANNPRAYGESARVRTVIQEYSKVVRELMIPFKNANIYGVKPRVEPVTLFLSGEPGVGKSVMVIPLMLNILTRVLKPSQLEELQKNYNNFLYTRQTEHEFWDRYYGQMVTIFDDFLQRRDTENATASEAMELIRISSMFPNVLHMAALEQKGTTVFNSKIIVCTSNFTTLSSVVSIQSREALRRRFTLSYALAPKKEFCTPATAEAATYTERRLDRTKFSENEVRLDIHEYHELRWLDNDTAIPTGKVLTFEEITSLVAETFDQRMCTFANYEKKNIEIIKDGIALRNRALEDKIYQEMTMKSQSGVTEDTVMFDLFDGSLDNEDSVVRPTLSDFENDADSDNDEEETVDEKLKEFPDIDLEFPQLRSRSYFFSSLTPGQVVYLYCCSLGKEAVNYFYLAQQGCSDARRRLLRVVNKATINDASRRAFCYAAFTTREFTKVIDLPRIEKLKLQIKGWLATMQVRIQSAWATPLIKGLTAFGSAVSMCWVLYSGYKKFFPRNVTQSGHARKNKPRRENVKSARLARLVDRQAPATWHSQSGADINARSLVQRLASKSCYRIWLEGHEETLGHCIFVRGRIMLTFSHLRDTLLDLIDSDTIDEDSCIYFENKTLTYKMSVIEFLELHFRDLAEKDAMLVEMPKTFHQHTDLVNHFVDKSLVNGHVDWTVCIGSYRSSNHFSEYVSIGRIKKDTVHHNGGKKYHVVDVLGYDAPTVSGDCGSVCILHNKSVQGKIVGIHICGSGTRGESTIITQQLLEQGLDWFEGDCLTYPPLIGEPAGDKAPGLGKGIVPVLMASQNAVICRKSKIIKSKLYEAWGPATTAPAILDFVRIDGVRIDPMRDNLARYCKNEAVVDKRLMEAVAANIASHYYNLSHPDRDKREILTFEQAVEGIPGAKYYEAIDRKSSPGYPWKNDIPPGHPGKSWWLGSGEEKPPYSSKQTMELREAVEGIIRDAKRGKRRDHIFLDFPKDERRSLAKIAQRKTRSISGAPMDFSIAMKMFFGAFAAFMMRNRLHNGCAVGINARSEEWGDLVDKLKVFLNIFAGDYEGFDTRMMAIILWYVLDIMNSWYNDSEENQRIRKVLWASVCNSLHVYEGTIYQWIMSNPSGNILTVILNGIVNEMYVQGAYALLHPLGVAALPFFYEDVVSITYGDDGIISVSDRAAPFFNQVTMAKAVQAFGQTYTDENKMVPTIPFRPLEELTFLKRGFRFEKNLRPPQWVAPLTMDTILEMPYWTKAGPGEDDITRSNANEALIELSLHGQEVFDKVGKEIITACKQRLNWMPERSTFQACIDFAMTHEVIY